MTEVARLASMFGLEFDATLFALLFARMSGFVMLLPGIGEEGVPPRVRLGFASALAVLLMPVAGSSLGTRLAEPLMLAIGIETALGLGLGLLMRIVYSTASVAGSYAATQIGLSGALFFDPAMGGQSTTVTRIVSLGALALLFALDLHHLLLRAMVHSYAVDLAGGLLARDATAAAVTAISSSFALGAQLAAPFLFYGIVFNLALGLVNRLAPQIQLFFIAQPVNLMLGMGLFALATGPMLLVFADRLPAMLSGVLG